MNVEKVNIVCPICREYGLTKVESFFHEIDMSSYKCLTCYNSFMRRDNILIEMGKGTKYIIERFIEHVKTEPEIDFSTLKKKLSEGNL
jgi:transposase-like protein